MKIEIYFYIIYLYSLTKKKPQKYMQINWKRFIREW